jgi:putative salt-induced outer membrane protein YdiY
MWMLTWVAFWSMGLAASADEVYLKNGNHLTGELVSMQDGKLTLETSFAGVLSIDWSQVERITADIPAVIVLSDGTIIRGIPSADGTPGRLKLAGEPGAEPVPVELTGVAAINPPGEPGVKFNGRINAGLNKASGNTDTESAHADAELIVRAVENRLTLGGAYNRASKDNRKSADNAGGYIKHDIFLTEKLYWYLNGEIEHDELKEINLWTMIGPGIGYQFFESELMNLSVEAGPSYVFTDYNQSSDEDSISGRWAVRFDRNFFNRLFQYYFSNEGYVSASDSSDVFTFTKTGFRFPLHTGFFLNAGFEWDWDNTPAEDADKSDYRYIMSLGYGF